MLVTSLVLAAGLLIRVPGLGDPPLQFHPTRQYRSALIARAFYVSHMSALSVQEARAVREAAAQIPALEPPVMERLASLGYRMLGREDLHLPRLMSVVAWTVGA